MRNVLEVKIVFGSWKAYTECNERALGSKWLDMSDFDSVEEIYEELRKEGFTESELEETFIQDYESEVELFENCDYVNIDRAFELLEQFEEVESYEVETLKAYIEIEGFSGVKNFVDRKDDLYLWTNCNSYSDLAYEMVLEGLFGEIPESIANYIDYEAIGRDLSFDNYYETSYGILEIR